MLANHYSEHRKRWKQGYCRNQKNTTMNPRGMSINMVYRSTTGRNTNASWRFALLLGRGLIFQVGIPWVDRTLQLAPRMASLKNWQQDRQIKTGQSSFPESNCSPVNFLRLCCKATTRSQSCGLTSGSDRTLGRLMLSHHYLEFWWGLQWRWYHPPMTTATAQANPNLAFIKYWDNRDWKYQTSTKLLAEFLTIRKEVINTKGIKKESNRNCP